MSLLTTRILSQSAFEAFGQLVSKQTRGTDATVEMVGSDASGDITDFKVGAGSCDVLVVRYQPSSVSAISKNTGRGGSRSDIFQAHRTRDRTWPQTDVVPRAFRPTPIKNWSVYSRCSLTHPRARSSQSQVHEGVSRHCLLPGPFLAMAHGVVADLRCCCMVDLDLLANSLTVLFCIVHGAQLQ